MLCSLQQQTEVMHACRPYICAVYARRLFCNYIIDIEMSLEQKEKKNFLFPLQLFNSTYITLILINGNEAALVHVKTRKKRMITVGPAQADGDIKINSRPRVCIDSFMVSADVKMMVITTAAAV